MHGQQNHAGLFFLAAILQAVMVTIEKLEKVVAALKQEVHDLKKMKTAPKVKRAPSAYNLHMQMFAKKNRDKIPQEKMFAEGAKAWRLKA